MFIDFKTNLLQIEDWYGKSTCLRSEASKFCHMPYTSAPFLPRRGTTRRFVRGKGHFFLISYVTSANFFQQRSRITKLRFACKSCSFSFFRANEQNNRFRLSSCRVSHVPIFAHTNRSPYQSYYKSRLCTCMGQAGLPLPLLTKQSLVRVESSYKAKLCTCKRFIRQSYLSETPLLTKQSFVRVKTSIGKKQAFRFGFSPTSCTGLQSPFLPFRGTLRHGITEHEKKMQERIRHGVQRMATTNNEKPTALQSTTALSGEVFKESFIDIFHTNLEQVNGRT